MVKSSQPYRKKTRVALQRLMPMTNTDPNTTNLRHLNSRFDLQQRKNSPEPDTAIIRLAATANNYNSHTPNTSGIGADAWVGMERWWESMYPQKVVTIQHTEAGHGARELDMRACIWNGRLTVINGVLPAQKC